MASWTPQVASVGTEVAKKSRLLEGICPIPRTILTPAHIPQRAIPESREEDAKMLDFLQKGYRARLLLIGVALLLLPMVSVQAGDDVGEQVATQPQAVDYSATVGYPETPEWARAGELADSALFAGAREEWAAASDSDLRVQIAYQLSFRRQFDFLDDGEETIAALLEARPLTGSLSELGLYLSANEWSEFQRRVRLGSLVASLRAAVTGLPFDAQMESAEWSWDLGPAFAGLWQDQMDGGKLKLALVQGIPLAGEPPLSTDSLLSMVPRGQEDLEIIYVRYSFDQLRAYKESVLDVMRSSDIRGIVSVDETANTVLVRTPQPFAVPAVPSDALTFVQVPVSELAFVAGGMPTAAHSAANLQSGLQIGVWDDARSCGIAGTWGFTGHTTSNTYIVTAGHNAIFAVDGSCDLETTLTSYVGYTDISQDADWETLIFRVNHAYTYARLEAIVDGARVLSNAYADTNCYHAGGECASFINQRLSLYNHYVGQPVCTSLGMTNGYFCGTVTDNDLDDPAVPLTNQVLADIQIQQGDSGAGIKYSTTAHGIARGFYGVYYGDVVFTPIYYIINRLDFDLNCVESGGWWTTCPVV